MNKKQLKQVIKPIIKECLMEIISESFIKEVVSEQVQVVAQPQVKKDLSSFVREESKKPQKREPTIEEVRQSIRAKIVDPDLDHPVQSRMDFQNPVFAELAKDTMSKSHALLDGRDDGTDNQSVNPNEIPEHIMEAAGLFNKDFSRHLKGK